MTSAAVHIRRLFFALWPDEAVRESLRRAARPAMHRVRGRPVPPSNYHMTLAFLGNVPDERLQPIIEAARRVECPRAHITFDRFGHFPAPRVFWIGARETPPALVDLSAKLWAAMESLGLEHDRRPFHVHLTLARQVIEPPEADPPPLVGWTVSEFVLAESETGPDGARYTVVERFSAVSANLG
jgi:2'-5' RNA ligase